MDEQKIEELKNIFFNAMQVKEAVPVVVEPVAVQPVVVEPPKEKVKRTRKKREYTDEQRKEMTARMAVLREKGLLKRQEKAKAKQQDKKLVIDDTRAVKTQVAEMHNKVSDIDNIKNELKLLKEQVETNKKHNIIPPIIPLLSKNEIKAPVEVKQPVVCVQKPVIQLPPPPPPPSVSDILGKYTRRYR